MPLMDEFKEEREEVKNRSFKERMKYFWDYYKWHVIGTVIGIIVVISLIHTFLSQKETVYYSVFINVAETWDSEDYRKEFETLAGINKKKEAVIFDADMRMDLTLMDQSTFNTTQKIMVYLSAKELDSMLADRGAINQYAYNDVLLDLREFLTAEELELYAPYLYYMDRSLLEVTDEDPTGQIPYPEDPNDASAMKEPVPVGLLLPECPKFRTAYSCGSEQYFCIFVNSQHPESNRLFFDYLMEN